MSVGRRQTISIKDISWEKYCELKKEHLRELGKPELSFSEFANASMEVANLTFKQILELRQNRSRKPK